MSGDDAKEWMILVWPELSKHLITVES